MTIEMRTEGHDNSPVLVSVVVPSYRGAGRVCSLLPQLLGQQTDFAYEILVVDDGSPEPLRSAMPSELATDRRVLWLRKENGGASSARNFGAARSRGEYLLFLDDDMQIPLDFIAAHIRAQREIGPAAVSAYYQTEVTAQAEPFRRWLLTKTSAWEEHSRMAASEIAPGIFEGHPSLLSSGNVSMPRELFSRVNGFAEDFRAPGVEDMDLGLRLGEDGVRVVRTNRVRPVHAEPRATLRQICERQRTGAALTVKLINRHRARWPELGRSDLELINGPLDLGREPLRRSVKKIIKSVLFEPRLRAAFFYLIEWIERRQPTATVLPRLYDAAMGIYIQEGWREGLEEARQLPRESS